MRQPHPTLAHLPWSSFKDHFDNYGFPSVAKEGDVEKVAHNMRQADLQEIRACGYGCPVEALRISYEGSKPQAYSAIVNDEPVAMMGVVPFEDNPEVGSIWLLGTDDIARNIPVSFLKWSIEFLPTLMGPYKMVCNRVDKRNKVHIKWLKWLKFTAIQEAPYGPYGLPFIEFAKLNES